MPVTEPSVQVSVQRILVTTDFSECSERALLTAIGVAQRYGSRLHLIHVVPREGYGVTGVGMFGAANFARHNARDLESSLLERGYLEGIRYRISMERGEVWPVVSRIVDEERIDLVVLGTRGRTGLGKLMLGSIAEKIFRKVACPVLTVGPNLRPSLPVKVQPGRILFPTDFSPQADHAFPYAVSLALDQQSQLICMHVVPSSGREATFNEDRASRYASARLRELTASVTRLAKEPEFMVETGDPAQAIVMAAAERRAELVVLGVRAPDSLLDCLGWSTAYGVVREASCPVLTVRYAGPS